MILSSEQIKVKLKEIWPNLKFIWPTNPNWTLVSDVWLPIIQENCRVDDYTFITGIWECENFAHQFKANVEVYQYFSFIKDEFKSQWRWAIGESIGLKSDLFGSKIVHGMNIIITENKVLVYEPQENKFLENNNGYDQFFVKF